MTKLICHHDFESYCEADIRKTGAFAYAMHPSCDALMLSWQDPRDGKLYSWVPVLERALPVEWDNKAARVYYGQKLPKPLVELLEDPEVEFHAHNAQFEAVIWWYVMERRYGAPHIAAERFVCTAVQCAAAGLPRSLGQAGMQLNLEIQKDKEGSKLINVFCKLQAARKPTKKNPDGVPPRRITADDEPEQFYRFLQYNQDDVLTECEIAEWVPRLSMREQAFYALDLEMNRRGLPLDMKAVRCGFPVVQALEQRVNKRVTEITGGIRPTQVKLMLDFMNGMGFDLENMQAKTLKDLLLLRKDDLTDEQIELLQLRVEGGKASTKKLKAMLVVVCPDGRVRGSFLFYGAHTGRWSGKLIQPQNFTRGEYKPHQLEQLIQFIYMQDAEILEMMYEWPIDAVAQGMRGFIKAGKGKKFVVCDFSAIEARMLAWLADEKEVLKIYHANGDVYIRMASKLYKVDEEELKRLVKIEEDKKAIGQRKFAKDIVLGCGYQMGGQGFYNNCVKRGILVQLDECKTAVKVYRAEHPAIEQFWYDTENAARSRL
jgi:DNA polymerase